MKCTVISRNERFKIVMMQLMANWTPERCPDLQDLRTTYGDKPVEEHLIRSVMSEVGCSHTTALDALRQSNWHYHVAIARIRSEYVSRSCCSVAEYEAAETL